MAWVIQEGRWQVKKSAEKSYRSFATY